MITVPGSLGVRLHTYPASLPLHPRVTSATLPSVHAALQHPLPAGATLYGLYATPSDLALAGTAVGVELTAACGSASTLAPAIQAAQQQGVAVRVVLQRCFDTAAGGDPDENTQQAALEADLALLAAELDVPCISLADCLGKATEESLRCAVEEAFYMDVAGETVRERLAVRCRAGLLSAALALGVTRVDAAPELVEAAAAALPPRVNLA